MSSSCLVVGGTGTIGSALAALMAERGIDFWITSRQRRARRFDKVISLDLADASGQMLPVKPRAAFLCAASTSILDCESNAQTTNRTNVVGNVAIARQLLEAGTFVIFLSSSAVFDGSEICPEERAPQSQNTEYGRQKAEAERQLMDLDGGRGNVAIVRITKAFSPDTPLIRRFVQHISRGERFGAFADLYISPVSLRYVVESLLEIERRRIGGIFHLSGSVELSYADFARRLAMELGVSPDLVRDSSVDQSPSPVLYRPRHPALGMAQTEKKVGLAPEPIDATLANLLADVAIRP